jgi:hypothetical protein
MLTIFRRIGHASPAMISRVYCHHMIKDTDVWAAETIEETFGLVRTD